MAESYSDTPTTTDESTRNRLLNDETLRRIGVAIAGLFTLAVGEILA
jgi:polar amino acid transport system permease protein